jgi:hypothetical protein
LSNFIKSIVAEILERNHPAATALISVASPVTVAPLVTVTSPVTVPIPAPALASVFAPAPASVSSATATPAASAAPATTAAPATPVASSAPAPGATAASTAASASSAPASASASPSCSAGKQADCPDTCSSPRDCPQPPGGIKRINYQKQQAGKRLALLGLPGSPGSTGSPVSHGSLGSLGSPGSPGPSGLPCASPTPVRLPDNAAQLSTRHLPQELPAASTATGRSPAVNVPGDHQSFAERCLSLPGAGNLPGAGRLRFQPVLSIRARIQPEIFPAGPAVSPGLAPPRSRIQLEYHTPGTPLHWTLQSPSSGMELWMPGCSL